ncbi:MAG: hypothetical protein NWE91_00455 [Candidatus Bathyarchaeota archaeon]|nr:hypothetical protein [Candidatus Bathyarchaeota archaeon]
MGDKKKQIVTSLRVNADIWKEARIQAIRHDLNLADLVEEAIELWIERETKSTHSRKDKNESS